MLTRAHQTAAACLVALFSSTLLAQSTQQAPTVAPAAPAPIAFLAPDVVIDAGRETVIAFRRGGAAGELRPSARTLDAAVCVITRPAHVLDGQSLGYVGIKGLAPGTTSLDIEGMRLPIKVVAPRAQAPFASRLPRIVNPASGASVWGQVAVAIEYWVNPSDTGPDSNPAPRLRLSDGRELIPISVTTAEQGPIRHALFSLDAESVVASTLELRPTVLLAGSPSPTTLEGGSISVSVAHPDSAQLVVGEAETRYDIERPKRFAGQRGSTASDPAASGGKFLVNAGSYPAFCFPMHVEHTGVYQVMLTARGTLAGTAYPTIGLVIDGADQPVTNGRIASTDWRRFTIGLPVRLEAGDRILTPYFENDFYVERLADRNLYIDRIEVLRLPDGTAAAGGGAGMMAPAMMAPAMKQPAPAQVPPSAAMPAMPQQTSAAMMQTPAMAGSASSQRPGSGLKGLDTAPLRIALLRPLEGKPLGGELQIDGICWTEGQDRALNIPRVTLLVNGTPTGSQRSAAPRFLIDPVLWTPGANTVQLVARLDSGYEVATPVQHLTWSDPSGDAARRAASGGETYPRRFERFTIHDERWDPSIKATLQNEKNPSELRAAAMLSSSELSLTLPEGLTGRFEVQLESMGQEFDGPPVASARLVAASGETPIGQTNVQTWWTPRPLGTVELKEEAKRLVIAFTNDKYQEGKGDRNLWFQAVVLRELPSQSDTAPPVVEVVSPAPGTRHQVYRVGAIVAQAADNTGVSSLELIIDSRPTGITADLKSRTGRVLLPILARSLAAGEHTVAVRAADAAGNSTTTGPTEFTVLTEAPPDLLPYERAVRLLNTLGFGPDPQELADALVMGERAFLTDRLDRPIEEPGELSAWSLGLIRFPHTRSEYDIPRRALTHALLTTNSVRARFVFWAQNHFSTWIRKDEADRKWDEHIMFSELGPAPFADLLMASAQSPAMLRYLDQQESYARRLNENYAREIMELHTLGVHGGYTQQDVTSLARLLTGWTTARQGDGAAGGEMRSAEFRFDPTLSEGASLEILGIRFSETSPQDRFDRAGFMLQALASHPSTAAFVSTKLAQHYLSVPAPQHIVDALSSVFLRSGGDMRQMILALADQPEFWIRIPTPRLAHPLQFALRLSRSSDNTNPWNIGDYLQRSGTGLFDRSTPDGYPEQDSAYTDSNALLQRWRLAQDNVWQLSETLPPSIRYGEFPKDPVQAAQWCQTVVDFISARLTGRLLDDASNQAALDVLAQGTGNRQERAQLVIPFIAQLPDVSLR